MKPGISIIVVVICALGATGCCHYGRGVKQASRPLPAALAEPFAYPKRTNFLCSEKEIAARSEFTVRRVELRAAGSGASSNSLIVLDVYAPNGPGKSPVLLVLPVMGGGYDLEEIFARYFARHGLAAIIVHRERIKDADGIAAIDPMLRQTVLDNKRVIDWIETRAEFDATRLGVFGASMGGIKGALLTVLDERVRAAVIGLAGGDLPYILRHTTEPGVSRQRERMLQREQLTPVELEARLKQSITCDPNVFAPYVDANKVLMFVAVCDTVVSNRKGRELREKMGRPEIILLPTGHFTAALCIPYIERQSLKFFRRILDLGREPVRSPASTEARAGRAR